MERTEMHVDFWWENLKEKDHFGNIGIHQKIILTLKTPN